MNLHKKTYVLNWNHTNPEDRHEITITKGGNPIDIKPERISYIQEEIGYWRKANQIHNWFVNNVQNGEDDCKEYFVDRTQLEELLELCQKVIKSPTRAKKLLPTQSGFFFGSEEYNEYYFESLKNTVKILEEALQEPNGDFYYSSSW